tara:strand:- start:65 stop:835 length:771 start_codon:yes stop_codon:yes gene_type:complete
MKLTKNIKLLSDPQANYKANKNIKLNNETYFLSFAHSDISGHNVCPMANKLIAKENNPKKSNCSSVCVGYNGNAQTFPNVMKSRIKKTKMFFEDRQNFMNALVKEIHMAIDRSNKKGFEASFRLNSYSDINWEKIKINKFGNNSIFELFPNTQFYDYSKLENRNTPTNYSLTYSHFGNWNATKRAIKKGLNVAMVFNKKDKLPNKYKGLSVVNGDENDLRTPKNDGKGVIVGLLAKMSKQAIETELKKDQSFIVNA